MAQGEQDRKCGECSARFKISGWELSKLELSGLPAPVDCPDCRLRRRMAQINQIHLFRRPCSAGGQPIVSNYPPESRYKVYSQALWWSDAFDGGDYGRDFDFTRPFFAQYEDLDRAVARPALFTDFSRDENSAYTNCAGLNKNCYMIFDSDENWECSYSFGMNGSRSSMDCYRVQNVELCYHAVDCTNCYGCFFLWNSEDCFDCALLSNCIGCRSCIMCSNLRQKEFYYRNEKTTKEHIQELRRQLRSRARTAAMLREFGLWRSSFPQRSIRGYRNEDVSGNYLVNCRSSYSCWDSMNLWDCRYCTQAFIGLRDSLDCHECGDAQLLYECVNVGYNAYECFFSLQCLSQISGLWYCNYCFNGCSSLFGCVGLKKRQFCILNKQYSREDYQELKGRIIDHMKRTGEWGRFFPEQTSAFAYNLTVAQEFYPLGRQEAVDRGIAWRDDADPAQSAAPCAPDFLPRENQGPLVFSCSSCRKSFKLIAQEMRFYEEQGIAPPQHCFLCRHTERLRGRNPRRLWRRRCAECGAEMETSYSPEREERVCCETCYQNLLD